MKPVLHLVFDTAKIFFGVLIEKNVQNARGNDKRLQQEQEDIQRQAQRFITPHQIEHGGVNHRSQKKKALDGTIEFKQFPSPIVAVRSKLPSTGAITQVAPYVDRGEIPSARNNA